jgi:hypothetical protein
VTSNTGKAWLGATKSFHHVISLLLLLLFSLQPSVYDLKTLSLDQAPPRVKSQVALACRALVSVLRFLCVVFACRALVSVLRFLCVCVFEDMIRWLRIMSDHVGFW